jgi:hypothetical protein
MCLETGCGCWGCSQNCCKCNYNCFKCSNIKNLIKSNWIYYEETYPFSDVRNKFVCFPCRRVWKSSISKYICNAANVTPEEKIAGIKVGAKVEVKNGELIVNGKKVPILTPDDLKKASIDFDALKIDQS